MSDTIDMAREVKMPYDFVTGEPIYLEKLKAFEALVRADERNSWPAEMEAMERQVNILTDALADEREACAKVCDELADKHGWEGGYANECAIAIRARETNDKR
jgi:hypothetical protein